MRYSKVTDPKIWKRYAESSLDSAERLLEDPPIIGEAVSSCQQAVEKHLKLFLAHHGKPIPMIHDLDRLAMLVAEVKDFHLDRPTLFALTALYSDARYGAAENPDGSLPTLAEAQEYLSFARTVAQTISAEIGTTPSTTQDSLI
jgi:HEPN domain-containing protein